jgi:site-specific recombinase XerD
MGKKPYEIDGLINEVSYFESWLSKNKNRALEQATQEDLGEFSKTLDEREIKITTQNHLILAIIKISTPKQQSPVISQTPYFH